MVSAENQPFLVTKDAAQLAQAMVTLLHDSPLRRRLGEANRLRAQSEFHESRMFTAYGRLFNQGAVPI